MVKSMLTIKLEHLVVGLVHVEAMIMQYHMIRWHHTEVFGRWNISGLLSKPPIRQNNFPTKISSHAICRELYLWLYVYNCELRQWHCFLCWLFTFVVTLLTTAAQLMSVMWQCFMYASCVRIRYNTTVRKYRVTQVPDGWKIVAWSSCYEVNCNQYSSGFLLYAHVLPIVN